MADPIQTVRPSENDWPLTLPLPNEVIQLIGRRLDDRSLRNFSLMNRTTASICATLCQGSLAVSSLRHLSEVLDQSDHLGAIKSIDFFFAPSKSAPEYPEVMRKVKSNKHRLSSLQNVGTHTSWSHPTVTEIRARRSEVEVELRKNLNTLLGTTSLIKRLIGPAASVIVEIYSDVDWGHVYTKVTETAKKPTEESEHQSAFIHHSLLSYPTFRTIVQETLVPIQSPLSWELRTAHKMTDVLDILSISAAAFFDGSKSCVVFSKLDPFTHELMCESYSNINVQRREKRSLRIGRRWIPAKTKTEAKDDKDTDKATGPARSGCRRGQSIPTTTTAGAQTRTLVDQATQTE